MHIHTTFQLFFYPTFTIGIRTMLEGKCVCCCVCGKLLQKSSLCNTEIRCWGCGTFLSVYVIRGIVVVASKGIEEKISLFDKMDMMLSN